MSSNGALVGKPMPMNKSLRFDKQSLHITASLEKAFTPQ